MYNVNDAVMYASYGVCIIKAIETRDFSGEDVEYYVFQPVGDDRNTFYVPTENSPLLDKMRQVYSKKEVEDLISIMPEESDIWIDNDAQRKEEFRSIIDQGDRRELVKLIKTLYSRKLKLNEGHKKLHSSDERFLTEAEHMLYDEFAYALNIPREQVLPYIKQAIDRAS
ncbi:CarD family transcriptional regulator [Ruminococcus sp. XPD3002]|uniref:CarD family transcriptional regulator n=1 Tax=Ruminococcus sp. XPD3002 TaxID=1452269 RepID=UPI00091C0214|nr:transcriptional regulator, CarD family [Ruminococcus flavefaciens]